MTYDMVTKPDFARTAARWNRFWRGEHPQPLSAGRLFWAAIPNAGREVVEKALSDYDC